MAAPSTGPSLPQSTGSGTAKTGGYGFGHEKFISSPKTPGKPPKTY
jgi:hypothetical protein